MTDDLLQLDFAAAMILADPDGGITELGAHNARLCYEPASEDTGAARLFVEVEVPFGLLGKELTVSLPMNSLRQIARWIKLLPHGEITRRD